VYGVARQQASVNLDDLSDSERDNVRVLECDLRNWGDIDRLAGVISGPLDVLINNAAVFGANAYYARDCSPDDMLQTFAVNVVGPTFLAQKLRPQLLAGARKLIVMVSTGNASLAANTEGEMLAYRATKSALNQVVRTIAAEWGPEGIITVALNPGWVKTRMGGLDAPLSPEHCAEEIFRFVVTADARDNGIFCNTNRHCLPW
jgi:NAD(P)-dependent dehydrogenase (short-subunit alcohol dehydrogenase family)